MQKNNFEIKVFKIGISLFLFCLVIFLSLIPINYSLSIGWVVGAFTAFITYAIGILLINKFFKTKKSKTLGFWVGMMRFYICLLIQAGLLIAVIAINRISHGHTLISGGHITEMYSPINIFTYIGGVSLILISTLVAQLLSRKEG